MNFDGKGYVKCLKENAVPKCLGAKYLFKRVPNCLVSKQKAVCKDTNDICVSSSDRRSSSSSLVAILKEHKSDL